MPCATLVRRLFVRLNTTPLVIEGRSRTVIWSMRNPAYVWIGSWHTCQACDGPEAVGQGSPGLMHPVALCSFWYSSSTWGRELPGTLQPNAPSCA